MESGGTPPHPDGTRPELLTADEVAALLRIHPDRVYRLIRERRLPAVHLGRTVRIERQTLMAWLAAGGTPSGT